MKSQQEIEQGLISFFASLQDKITNFSVGGIARAWITAISAMAAEVYVEINSILRRLFWTTGKGTDLDYLGDELGIERLGAYYASTILVFKGNIFNGTSTSVGSGYLNDTTANWIANEFINGIWILVDSAGTQFTITGNYTTQLNFVGTPASGTYSIHPKVPSGTTILSSVDSTPYVTQSDVIVGIENVGLLGQSNSVSLGSRTIAVCSTSGEVGAVQAGVLTVISPSISGIDSVTNPIPSQPRQNLDAETDDAYRNRVRNSISIYNQGTQAFFQAAAVAANSNVVVAFTKKDPSGSGVIVTIANRGQTIFSSDDLTAIATFIQSYCRDEITITVQNMVMTDIVVTMGITMVPGTLLQDAYVAIADVIADYLDYGAWNLDNPVRDDDLLVLIKQIPSILDIDLDSYLVQAYVNSVFYGQKIITLNQSYPRLARLTLTDEVTSTVKDMVLEQAPVNQAKFIPASVFFQHIYS